MGKTISIKKVAVYRPTGLETNVSDIVRLQLHPTQAINEILEYIGDTGWIYVGTTGAPAFVNGWSNDSSADYNRLSFRRISDVVWIRGVVFGGTLGSVVTNLPIGFRPQSSEYIPAFCAAGASQARIEANGNLSMIGGSVTRNFFDGVSFFVG